MKHICISIILPSSAFASVHCHCFDAPTQAVWFNINLKGTYSFALNKKLPYLDKFMSKTEGYRPVKKSSIARNVYRAKNLDLSERLRARFSSTLLRQIIHKNLTDVTHVAYMSTYETAQQI